MLTEKNNTTFTEFIKANKVPIAVATGVGVVGFCFRKEIKKAVGLGDLSGSRRTKKRGLSDGD